MIHFINQRLPCVSDIIVGKNVRFERLSTCLTCFPWAKCFDLILYMLFMFHAGDNFISIYWGPTDGESEAVEFDPIKYHNFFCPWTNGNVTAAGVSNSHGARLSVSSLALCGRQLKPDALNGQVKLRVRNGGFRFGNMLYHFWEIYISILPFNDRILFLIIDKHRNVQFEPSIRQFEP